MKKIIFLLGIIFLNSLVDTYAQTQQTACASSNQGTAGGVVVSYTIGEMVLVDNAKVNGLFITQGIAQPEAPFANINFDLFTAAEIKVYPNPTPDLLSVQIGILKAGRIKLQLLTVEGQIVITDEFDVNTFMTKKYELRKFANATYLLKLDFVSTDKTMNKKGTYKIVKTN